MAPEPSSANFGSSVSDLATRKVITIPSTNTIMSTLKSMLEHNFRRIPVAEEGTKTIKGIITASDLLSFFGGDSKYGIVERVYCGNLQAAVNGWAEDIMEKEVVTVRDTDSWDNALDLMLRESIGGCPVVDERDKVVGIVTERDMLKFLVGHAELVGCARDCMSKDVLTARFNETIGEVIKLMIFKRFRRLPIIKGETLAGLVTVREILRYFGTGEALNALLTGNIKEALDEPVSTILKNPQLLIYKEPLTFSSHTPLSKIASNMLEKKYGSALVLDKGKLEGIITEMDIVKFLYNSVDLSSR